MSQQRLRVDWERPAPDRFGPESPHFVDAMNAHDAAVRCGEGGYLDPRTGLFVMTATTLSARPCCDNECRHCPWQR